MLSANNTRTKPMATAPASATAAGGMPPLAPKPKKMTFRQAIGIIIGDPQTNKVLMLSSRKRPGALVLPRGDVEKEANDSRASLKVDPLSAALHVLQQEADVATTPGALRHLGTFAEANKRGKTIGHHFIYEVPYSSTTFLPSKSGRTRTWVTFQEALQATLDRPMSHLALRNSIMFAHHLR